MISHKYKFIFIHIPKTGGLSVFNALMPFCDDDKFMRGHASQSDYLKISKLENYYQFSFVRNPFARLVSAYFFLKGGGHNNKHDKKIRDRLKLSGNNFRDFIRNDLGCLIEDRVVHFIPQLNFLNSDVSKVEIFKIENINFNFKKVCDRIGISNQKILHLNKTKHFHYSEYYDFETKQIVAEKYAKDIDFLGYEFENK